MSEPSATLLQEILRFAPLPLTVAGWWLVNRQNNRREVRKEHRALVDTAKRDIRSIADNARTYFTHTDSTLSAQIKWSLDALELELGRLDDETKALSSALSTAFSRFAEACTNGEFEQKNRRRLDETSEQIRAIYLTCNRLIATIEERFSALYVIKHCCIPHEICGLFKNKK